MDASFSACLTTAWRVAKQNRAKAADAAKVAKLADTPAGKRFRALGAALAETDTLLFRYSAAARRAAIKSEIAAITAH